MLIGFLQRFLAGALTLAGLAVGAVWLWNYWPYIWQGRFGGHVTLLGYTVPGWYSVPMLIAGSYFSYVSDHTVRARFRID